MDTGKDLITGEEMGKREEKLLVHGQEPNKLF